MKILLDEFEHQIDETILKRGLDYFKKGYVTDVNELGGGNYEITVEGTEIYTVNLSIEGNAVRRFECDCPYDMGPVCKHVVAALFYLQKDTLDITALPAKKATNKKKEKSVAVQAEELLNTLSLSALKAFIHDVCVKDSNFRQLFVAKHIHLLYPESKELYKKQLQALIKTYSDKDGFVDYQNAKRLGNSVYEMAAAAMADLSKGQIQKAMFVALAIIEEMAYLFNYYVDDSLGQIGSGIEEAFAILEDLTQLELNDIQHDELFGCLLNFSEQESLEGWDWHFNSIALGIKLVKNDQEKERIKLALEKIKPTGKKWDWNYQKSQELMLELIRKTEGNETATRFIEDNLSNPQFRTELIEKALVAKEYETVERLAYEGIARDEKESPGLADDWRHYLLLCYQQTGDIKNTIQLARYFLIHSNGRRHPLAYYYDLLKSLVPEEQWHDYLEDVIKEIKQATRWTDYERISQLYILEADWDKLFELLRQNVSFERIASAERYLADAYSNELAALYKKFILTYLEENTGRTHYQTVCRYIRRIIKLRARPMATDLIQELKVLYPTRRALLEELDKV